LSTKKTEAKKTFFSFLSLGINAQKYTVVLDAGHGGKDGGASRGHYVEKKIVLSLALKVGKILEKDNDVKVIYTRKTDDFIELHKRATIANNSDADLFVSLHCNANNSEKPHGAETYVLGLNGNDANLEIVKKENAVILLENDYEKNYDYDPNSPESVIGLSVLQEENLDESLAFAGLVQGNFKDLKRHDRSVKQANFLVLRETVMPSVLIELGFLSNKEEGSFLNKTSGQSMMAGAVAKAIRNYLEYLRINTVEVKDIEEVSENSSLEYKVQIAASKHEIPLKSYNFKGLKGVTMIKKGDFCKYFYGNVSKFEKTKSLQEDLKQAGYKDFFVVPFHNGKQISLKEALKIE